MKIASLSSNGRHVEIAALIVAAGLLASFPGAAFAQTRIRNTPSNRAEFAVGQRFDIRVEATNAGGDTVTAPHGLTVSVDAVDVTRSNVLDPSPDGERGMAGTGSTRADLPVHKRAGRAPVNTTNFLVRDYSFTTPGRHVIRARTRDGAEAEVHVTATAWDVRRDGASRVRNVILLLGDGLGAAHRTAARIVSRGVTDGKADGLLAMDTMEVTGQVMTFSLNSVITDSSPGMAAYATGHKSNNNQQGVYPDNTDDMFDNPRVEYIGELLRRVRGRTFNVGIVTTADVTDSTPAANAVHTADRNAGPEIAAQFFDERATNGVTVLMGGGARHVSATPVAGSRKDGRDLVEEFRRAGYQHLRTNGDIQETLKRGRAPAAILGLFHPRHLAVAFDKIGAGRYSDELALEKNAAVRDQPMLDDMTRLALASLSEHSPAGFYRMGEGASIDKQAHAVDAERTVWDTIEFDNAVRVALDFARRTNTDGNPGNDTLVIVTADHETGGLGLIAVGNERYDPATFGSSVRDYAAVLRFAPEQLLNFFPNYERDTHGYPVDPDPSRKLLLGWAAAPDRNENWISNRLAHDNAAATAVPVPTGEGRSTRVSVANPARDGALPSSDNKTVEGVALAGFLVPGTIENGAHACVGSADCPGDTSPSALTIAGHTRSDVPLSASGPGALQFTGTYDNTSVFLKMLRAVGGSYSNQPGWSYHSGPWADARERRRARVLIRDASPSVVPRVDHPGESGTTGVATLAVLRAVHEGISFMPRKGR